MLMKEFLSFVNFGNSLFPAGLQFPPLHSDLLLDFNCFAFCVPFMERKFIPDAKGHYVLSSMRFLALEITAWY
jgi:hypothetical protein